MRALAMDVAELFVQVLFQVYRTMSTLWRDGVS